MPKTKTSLSETRLPIHQEQVEPPVSKRLSPQVVQSIPDIHHQSLKTPQAEQKRVDPPAEAPIVRSADAADALIPRPSLDYQTAQAAPQPPITVQQSIPPIIPKPEPQPSPLTPSQTPDLQTRHAPLGRQEGDLIWTGQLEKGTLLTINGLLPSNGVLRGDPLPGVPVQLTLQPADIIVSQAPMSIGDYRRFVLRSPGRRNTVVRVHWEILR